MGLEIWISQLYRAPGDRWVGFERLGFDLPRRELALAPRWRSAFLLRIRHCHLTTEDANLYIRGHFPGVCHIRAYAAEAYTLAYKVSLTERNSTIYGNSLA